ncbi:putative adhesin [Streptomyces sp. NPDC048419]|uniref:putative adhesin n=1 Tax=Streptomyces sp. NPDC048419 TaxID=3365547 RepID=UPI00371F0AD3
MSEDQPTTPRTESAEPPTTSGSTPSTTSGSTPSTTSGSTPPRTERKRLSRTQIEESVKEGIASEIQEMLKSGDLGRLSREELEQMRKEWASFLSRIEDKKALFNYKEDERVEEFLTLEEEEQKMVQAKEKRRRSSIVARSESTPELQQEAPVTISIPETCLICGEKFVTEELVVSIRHETTLHMMHYRTGCLNEEPSSSTIIAQCPTCTEIYKANDARTGVIQIPEKMTEPKVTLMGHGNDSPPGAYTFVPHSMKVHTFVDPGKTLGAWDAILIAANPGAIEANITFRPGAEIPNMTFAPDSELERELETLALTNVVDIRGIRSNSGRVRWLEYETALCSDQEGCQQPFHTCTGLLSTYYGVEDLYIATCFGGGGVKERLEGSDLEATYGYLMNQIMETGKTDVVLALSLFERMPGPRKWSMIGDPQFASWYNEALELTAREK